MIAHQPPQLIEVINLRQYTVRPEGLQLYIIQMDAIRSACLILIKHVELHLNAKRYSTDTSHYHHHYLLGGHGTCPSQGGVTDLWGSALWDGTSFVMQMWLFCYFFPLSFFFPSPCWALSQAELLVIQPRFRKTMASGGNKPVVWT